MRFLNKCTRKCVYAFTAHAFPFEMRAIFGYFRLFPACYFRLFPAISG